MGGKRHKTNSCYQHLITLGCALLLFSLAGVYWGSPLPVVAAELATSASTISNSPTQSTVPPPNVPVTTSASPVPTPSNDVKQTNPLRRFFSWIGRGVSRLFRRSDPFVCYLPPTVSISSSTSVITFCPTSNVVCSPSGREVSLSAYATDPDNSELLFTWTVTAGRLTGEGRKVTWNLNGVPEGTYTATVEMKDGSQHTVASSTSVRVELCSGCESPVPLCPVVSVSCPDAVNPKQPITFQANVSGGDSEMKPTYTWSVTAGRIISGQGTPKITVDISNLGGQSVTATVSLGGMDPACSGTLASCTIIDY
jgi:hypothetical protein